MTAIMSPKAAAAMPKIDAFLVTQEKRDRIPATLRAFRSDLHNFRDWWEEPVGAYSLFPTWQVAAYDGESGTASRLTAFHPG